MSVACHKIQFGAVAANQEAGMWYPAQTRPRMSPVGRALWRSCNGSSAQYGSVWCGMVLYIAFLVLSDGSRTSEAPHMAADLLDWGAPRRRQEKHKNNAT